MSIYFTQYGADIWVHLRKEGSEFQRIVMKFLRSIVGLTKRDRARNENIRNMIGVIWNFKMMRGSRIVSWMLDYKMEGRRRRGRQRRRVDGIRKGEEAWKWCWRVRGMEVHFSLPHSGGWIKGEGEEDI